ncbi:MAG: nucleoside triphosphate pyrophosphatase [Granulosicoccus sp.]
MTNTGISDENAPVLVLASQSPRRLELLKQIGFTPQCLPADVDETPLDNETPNELVMRLASLKASACIDKPGFSSLIRPDGKTVILAADTVIDLDGQLLGKPTDEAHALDMLQQLSGREHLVHSGVCVLEADTGKRRAALVTTSVQFTTLTRQVAQRYWRTGEPLGKSGSYAIQGTGAQFVVQLSGSYSNVVGLPLYETTQLLARSGLSSL